MVKSRRVFTREFKLAAVRELESGKPLGYVARQLEVSPNTLHRWRRELKAQPTKAFSGPRAQALELLFQSTRQICRNGPRCVSFAQSWRGSEPGNYRKLKGD